MIDAPRYIFPMKHNRRNQMFVAILGLAAIAGIYFVTRWLMEEVPPPPPQQSHFDLGQGLRHQGSNWRTTENLQPATRQSGFINLLIRL